MMAKADYVHTSSFDGYMAEKGKEELFCNLVQGLQVVDRIKIGPEILCCSASLKGSDADNLYLDYSPVLEEFKKPYANLAVVYRPILPWIIQFLVESNVLQQKSFISILILYLREPVILINLPSIPTKDRPFINNNQLLTIDYFPALNGYLYWQKSTTLKDNVNKKRDALALHNLTFNK